MIVYDSEILKNSSLGQTETVACLVSLKASYGAVMSMGGKKRMPFRVIVESIVTYEFKSWTLTNRQKLIDIVEMEQHIWTV